MPRTDPIMPPQSKLDAALAWIGARWRMLLGILFAGLVGAGVITGKAANVGTAIIGAMTATAPDDAPVSDRTGNPSATDGVQAPPGPGPIPDAGLGP